MLQRPNQEFMTVIKLILQRRHTHGSWKFIIFYTALVCHALQVMKMEWNAKQFINQNHDTTEE
jgi:cell division protein FtsL